MNSILHTYNFKINVVITKSIHVYQMIYLYL